jgi:DNA invertase Pin-like site-specific DNA recombinase
MVAYIAYYRVSTGRQGQSGLGLEAQQQAVHHHMNSGRGGSSENIRRSKAASVRTGLSFAPHWDRHIVSESLPSQLR